MGLIGRSMPKLDNAALATGAARFTGDMVLPGMLHGRMVRSPHAHARVVAVDATAARRLDGVADVIVPDDVRHLPRFSMATIVDQEVLCTERVRFVGDAVAAVFAETDEIAEAAAELVEVTYEPLPAILDAEASLDESAPLIHDELPHVDGNACWRQVTRAGDIEAAFAEAEVVVRQRFRTSKQHAMPMETHAVLAEWDRANASLTLWASTQQAHVLRDMLAVVLGLPRSRVRVIKPFVGGAFGHKEGLNSHEALAALAARRTSRPVRFVLSRYEEFSATVSRNPQVRDVELALMLDGRILGWRERIVQDCGAYAGICPSVLALSEWVTVGPYRTPALDIEGVLVYTNHPPAGAFRGFGNPQATFTRELTFDIAARRIGMDPVEFRRRNYITKSALPTTTANGLLLKTLPIEECTDLVLGAIDRTVPSHPGGSGRLRGTGVVSMLEWGGGCRWHVDFDADISSVSLAMAPDGSVTVHTDAADSGQGHTTLFTQIVGDRLGVAPDQVRVILADSQTTPYGLGTFGSRTAVVAGSAAYRACETLLGRLKEVAAHLLEARPEDLVPSDGRLVVAGTDTGIAIAEVARLIHGDRAALPPGMEPGALVVTESYDTASTVPDAAGRGNFAANYTCATMAVTVEIDTETGAIEIVDLAVAEDVGRAINPDIVTTQLQGGIAQGIGFALGEELLFDEAGSPTNASMVDYQVPTCPGIPAMEAKLFHVESNDPTHPLGQKGVGESGITPPAAAIACAVYDAIGVPITSLPITAEKVLNALDGLRAGSGGR